MGDRGIRRIRLWKVLFQLNWPRAELTTELFCLTLLGPPGDPGTVSDVSERRSFEDEFGMIVARKGEKGDQVGVVIKKNTR